MNKHITTYGIMESNLNHYQVSLLNLFVLMSDDQYKCFPTVGTITKMTHMCVTTYKKTINSLIEMGLVIRQYRYNKESGQQRSNYFYLNTFLFSDTRQGITLLINKAIAMLNEKRKQQQQALHIVADANSEDILNQENKLNIISNVFHHQKNNIIKTADKIGYFFSKLFHKQSKTITKKNQCIFKTDGGSPDDHIKFNSF